MLVLNYVARSNTHRCVLPSTGHHQLHFDSVGHQDSQDLLVGDILDAETQNRTVTQLRRHTCTHTSEVSYMVEEARLVSSCLSFPSSARPLFSRFLSSVGVRVYTLQNVELDDTWSLTTWHAAVSQRLGSTSPNQHLVYTQLKPLFVLSIWDIIPVVKTGKKIFHLKSWGESGLTRPPVGPLDTCTGQC